MAAAPKTHCLGVPPAVKCNSEEDRRSYFECQLPGSGSTADRANPGVQRQTRQQHCAGEAVRHLPPHQSGLRTDRSRFHRDVLPTRPPGDVRLREAAGSPLQRLGRGCLGLFRRWTESEALQRLEPSSVTHIGRVLGHKKAERETGHQRAARAATRSKAGSNQRQRRVSAAHLLPVVRLL